jgi:chromosome segregation ATPase
MIESIMYAGIGFLVASLLVIGVIPLVHGRAVRLTMKRLEAVTPMSMGEIQADKDQLRAEFAMSTRRLEMSVEQLKAKTTSQLAEIGKKSEAIGRLKLELGEKTAQLFALEARDKEGHDQLATTAQDLAGKTAALQRTEQMLAETKSKLEQALAQTRADLEKTTADYKEAAVTADGQRVELVALRAQIEVLKGQIESYDKETRQLQERLVGETATLAAANQNLAQERAKSETLNNRIAELERLLVTQTTESEILGRRVHEVSSRLDEQSRFLAEREYSSDQLRNVASEAQKTEADVRAELAETHSRLRVSTDNLRAEKALVEDQLRLAQAEREQLQREISGMKRQAESTWASERMENAVLRERINDVAAEVARLTSALEGPTSPINSMLGEAGRAHAGSYGNGESRSPALAPDGETRGTLADRIRLLQSRASAVPQPT